MSSAQRTREHADAERDKHRCEAGLVRDTHVISAAAAAHTCDASNVSLEESALRVFEARYRAARHHSLPASARISLQYQHVSMLSKNPGASEVRSALPVSSTAGTTARIMQ